MHFSRLNHFALIFPLLGELLFSPLFMAVLPTLACVLVISDAVKLEMSSLTQGKKAHLHCRHLFLFTLNHNLVLLIIA